MSAVGRQLDVVRRPVPAIGHLHHPCLGVRRGDPRLRGLGLRLGGTHRREFRQGRLDAGHPLLGRALLGRLRRARPGPRLPVCGARARGLHGREHRPRFLDALL